LIGLLFTLLVVGFFARGLLLVPILASFNDKVKPGMTIHPYLVFVIFIPNLIGDIMKMNLTVTCFLVGFFFYDCAMHKNRNKKNTFVETINMVVSKLPKLNKKD